MIEVSSYFATTRITISSHKIAATAAGRKTEDWRYAVNLLSRATGRCDRREDDVIEKQNKTKLKSTTEEWIENSSGR